jgi:hypothetical protein
MTITKSILADVEFSKAIFQVLNMDSNSFRALNIVGGLSSDAICICRLPAAEGNEMAWRAHAEDTWHLERHGIAST